MRRLPSSVPTIVVCLLGLLATRPAPANGDTITFTAVTLVSSAVDPDLAGPWGLASSATSPFWVGANGSGAALLYDGTGARIPLTVAIPGDGSVTGVAFNASGGGSFNGDNFLFVSEDGTISGWRGALGTSAEVLATALPGNTYTGLDLLSTGGHVYAYIANFQTGMIDVLKGDPLAPDLPAHFVDPNLPAGYAPYNVSVIGGLVYVTYALRDTITGEPITGAGHGFVDVFNPDGSLVKRLASGGALDTPWGLALAPAGFGNLAAAALLVANSGDGHINAYDLGTGLLLETLLDPSLSALTIDGLRALRFGNGGNGGDIGTLYFTAAPGGDLASSFGKLAPSEATTGGTTSGTGSAPEPASLGLLALGLGAAAFRRR